jgi:Asp-tRNA(Asn)/Glu-tRNA(Gln) amidotransferase A subunit family amidase
MGSVIRPASYCGVLGFKPSFGVVSRAGLMKLAPELDTVGWFANVPEDLELVWECLQQWQADHLKVSSVS